MHPTSFQIPVNTLPFHSNSLRIRRSSAVPPSLQTYECHFNWAKLYPLTFHEIGHGALLLQEKFRDEARELEHLLLQTSTGISLIGKKMCQAYFNLEIGNFPEARKCLQEAEKFIELCTSECNPTFSPDYTDGFTYVLEGLWVFLEIQISSSHSPSSPTRSIASARSLPPTPPRVRLEGLRNFKRLPAKGKHIVWTVKDVFLIYSFRSNVERSDWMEAILEMEPYIPKWHFHLYKALHNARKLRPRPLPFGQERIVAEDPLSISYFCICLAEIVVERQEANQYPVVWGIHRFETSDQVLSAIFEKTILVLQMDCHMDGVYLNFAEIHMFRLPPLNRNMELATRCLKKALRLNNTNPKTHYRMGFAQFKLGNPKQAALHFQEGIKNPNNLGAIFGLLQLWMAAPAEHSAEIQNLFRDTMKNQELTKLWDKRCLRTLHYLKGCFHFMQENNEESLNDAITSWIIAHDNESPKWSYYFMNLSHQCRLFGWPTKRLNLSTVSNALKHAAYLEQTQFKQLLLDICSEVDDAIRRDEERKNSRELIAANK